MDKKRNRKFYSWEIVDNNNAIKTCDKSFFVHKGTGIPQEITWFFGADDMSPGKKTIHLKYCGKTYSADIFCLKREGTFTVQLQWRADLGNELLKIKKAQANDYTGYAQFTRCSNDEFAIEILSGKSVASQEIATTDTPLEVLDKLISFMTEQEAVFLKLYTEALNIEDTEPCLVSNNVQPSAFVLSRSGTLS